MTLIVTSGGAVMNQLSGIFSQNGIKKNYQWYILVLLGFLVLTIAFLVQTKPAIATANCTQIPDVTDNTSCIVREESVTLTAGQSVVINANVKVNDGNTVGLPPSNQSEPRYLMNVRVKCYNSADQLVWLIDGSRNIWDGIGLAGAYPRGVFVAPSTGTYLCQLDAVQRNLHPTKSPDRKFAVYSSALAVSAPFAQGFSSPGTLKTPYTIFPSGADDLTASNPHNPIMRHEVSIGKASSYTLTAHVHLSSCSFNSDINSEQACSSFSTYNDKSFDGTMRLYARQRTAADTGYCGPSFIVDTPFSIPKATHHFTATSTGSLTQTDPTCTGPLIVKVELLDLQGRGYLGHGDTGTSISHIGAAWN